MNEEQSKVLNSDNKLYYSPLMDLRTNGDYFPIQNLYPTCLLYS